ncbi:MAG: dockerin type I repeat-containing protein, partial [Myxococcota bacterium]
MRHLAYTVVLLLAMEPLVSLAGLLGDVNGDGKVDVGDLVLETRIVEGTYTPTAAQRDAADVAPVGIPHTSPPIIDSNDLVVFLRAIQGDDVDGDGLDADAEIGGSAATTGSPFLGDTDGDGIPDNVDAQRGSFLANQPPEAPSLDVNSSTTTSLGGTVSACSNPDDLPYPSTCTQSIAVVEAGASCQAVPIVSPVTPTSGSWTVSGLASGVVYTAYARSSDGALEACSLGRTAATVATGTAAVVPHLVAPESTTNDNPLYIAGIGAPGQQVRVFVNGVEQDFVRTFATGNTAFPTNPFVVPASGAFSVPVVLDDGINVVTVRAISSSSEESTASNEVTTKYENEIPRGTSNPLRILPQPTPDDPNSEEIAAGQIFVLTKGDVPGFTAEYYLDRHLEAKENALLVIGAGADLRFAGPTPFKSKIIVSGTLRTRAQASNRVRTYHTSPSSVVLNYWDGVEIRSTSRGTSLSGISIRNTSKAVTVIGTVSSRPDLELRESAIELYDTTGVDISTAGQITVSGNDFQVNASGTGPCFRDGLIATASTGITISKNLLNGARYGFTVVDTPAVIEENESDPGTCVQNSPTLGAAIRVVG